MCRDVQGPCGVLDKKTWPCMCMCGYVACVIRDAHLVFGVWDLDHFRRAFRKFHYKCTSCGYHVVLSAIRSIAGSVLYVQQYVYGL